MRLLNIAEQILGRDNRPQLGNPTSTESPLAVARAPTYALNSHRAVGDTLLAQVLPDMDILLRYFVIALVLVVGIAFLAVCGDVLCSTCADLFLSGGDRSGPLARVVRFLINGWASAAPTFVALFALVARGLDPSSAAPDQIHPLMKVSSLRL